MSEKHSAASKKRWSRVSKTERSKRMRELVGKRHAKMTQAQKNKLGRKLTAARLAKRAKDTS